MRCYLEQYSTWNNDSGKLAYDHGATNSPCNTPCLDVCIMTHRQECLQNTSHSIWVPPLPCLINCDLQVHCRPLDRQHTTAVLWQSSLAACSALLHVNTNKELLTESSSGWLHTPWTRWPTWLLCCAHQARGSIRVCLPWTIASSTTGRMATLSCNRQNSVSDSCELSLTQGNSHLTPKEEWCHATW